MPTRARFAALGGLIAAIWLIALSRWIATDTVVPWDSKNQFFAFFRFLATALHSGSTPFWNPYHYGGHPSVADPQSLVLSPAFVLWALFDPTPSLRGFDLIVYAHLLVGGLAMGALGWRARWPLSACVMAAALFMFGSAAAGRLQHTGIILSYALFPPALLLLQLALARHSIMLALAFALVAAQLALGRNQVALFLCVLLAAFALAEIVTADRPMRYLRERLAVLSIMALGVTALVAAPMLLTLQFAALSNRPAVGFEEAIQGSLHPANLATLAVADVFGTHGPNYWGPGAQTLPEVRFTDNSFNYLFVGAGTTALFLWFGIAGAGAFRRGRRLLTAALVVSLLYMLGRYTPFFPFAFAWWPGVSLFRRPVDASFVFLIALALLSGYLLADYVREGLPRLRIAPSVVCSGRRDRRRRIGGSVFCAHRPRRRCVFRCAGGRAACHPAGSFACRGALAADARLRGGGRRHDRGRRTGLVERRLPPQRRESLPLCGAGAANRRRSAGDRRPGRSAARAARARRTAARGSARSRRAVAEPRERARMGSDQRLQSFAHRRLRSSGRAGGSQLAARHARLSRVLRRL